MVTLMDGWRRERGNYLEKYMSKKDQMAAIRNYISFFSFFLFLFFSVNC